MQGLRKEAKRGDKVSLNTGKRAYYFQDGEHGLYLAIGKCETAVISDKISEYQLSQINHDLQAEHLTIGWPEKPAVEQNTKEGELEAVLLLGRNKINDWMYALRDDKKAKAEVKTSQIEKLIVLEKAGKNRKSVLDAAEAILSFMGGVSPVEETEKQKVEIKLTSGNSEEAAVK